MRFFRAGPTHGSALRISLAQVPPCTPGFYAAMCVSKRRNLRAFRREKSGRPKRERERTEMRRHGWASYPERGNGARQEERIKSRQEIFRSSLPLLFQAPSNGKGRRAFAIAAERRQHRRGSGARATGDKEGLGKIPRQVGAPPKAKYDLPMCPGEKTVWLTWKSTLENISPHSGIAATGEKKAQREGQKGKRKRRKNEDVIWKRRERPRHTKRTLRRKTGGKNLLLI